MARFLAACSNDFSPQEVRGVASSEICTSVTRANETSRSSSLQHSGNS